jgi:hypothetical protein
MNTVLLDVLAREIQYASDPKVEEGVGNPDM